VEKVITTMLLMIAGIVATAFVINAVLPAVQRASTDIVAASDAVGNRMRSDVRIIEVFVDGADEVQVRARTPVLISRHLRRSTSWETDLGCIATTRSPPGRPLVPPHLFLLAVHPEIHTADSVRHAAHLHLPRH
jgi:hypothetical protein